MPTPCQVCAATERHPFAEREDSHFGTLTLWQCDQCDFVYLDPMPKAQALAALYDSDTGAGYFAKAERKFARSQRRIRRLNKYATTGRFLDVGCNGGFMVEAARRAGFEAVGIDPAPAPIDWARNHFPATPFSAGDVGGYMPVAVAPVENLPHSLPHLASRRRLRRPDRRESRHQIARRDLVYRHGERGAHVPLDGR